MESHWINEQEASHPWLLSPSASEQENVLDWLKSIGTGAAQGAGTGAAVGPWGALIGGLIGGGLGALQQATQQQQPAPQRPSPPPAASRPAPRPTPQPPAPVAPSPAAPTSSNKDGVGAVQQFTQLLPQLVQLIQAIQPIAASAPQGKGRAGEGVDEEVESLAGDRIPDSAFLDEQETELSPDEDDQDESIELPEPLEPAQARMTGALLPTQLEPPASALQPIGAPTLTLPGEWVTEAESAGVVGTNFQWVG